MVDESDPSAGRPSRRLPPSSVPLPGAGTGAPLPERYQDLGVIGRGGMGEVRRVRDRELHRTLALKWIHPRLVGHPASLERFLEEARATAQLQHPHIVPVHDLGRLPDGRVWFTMKEVRGRTLAEVIEEAHREPGVGWTGGGSGWTLHRLISVFLAVCHAAAYAHERGVLHRDLKPSNVMIGEHGEVYVLDWGLAKVVGRAEPSGAAEPGPEAVESGRSSAHATEVGQIAGTPAYMSPEQARGEADRLDARTDVYALGTILFEILQGEPAYSGTVGSVLTRVLIGPAPELRVAGRAGRPLPEALASACRRAMARDPADRHPSASALASEVQAWLDGSRRREAALEVVREAEAELPRAEEWRSRARSWRAEAEAALAGLQPWDPAEAKAGGWALEDRAAEAENQASIAEMRREERLRAALTHDPELVEAHASLLDLELARHAAAERARDGAGQARAELRLAEHLAALPSGHAAAARATVYLRGEGSLTLRTDPPGAEVVLWRFEARERRMVPVEPRSLGLAPLESVPLPRGSWLCEVRHPERLPVRYPVSLERGERWDGVPPGGSEPWVLRLPRPEELGPQDVFVPAGWCWIGGDPVAFNPSPRRRVWVDDLVVRRFPVTHREYLGFLHDLVDRGRAEEAALRAPREKAGAAGELGALVYGFDGRRFSLRVDADGVPWDPEWPVFQVDWGSAVAFARWEAEREGLPWRLPFEVEREKASRGVDGRWHPWGDAVDASWCRNNRSQPGRPLPVKVTEDPTDESVYGVRGAAGNISGWCADRFRPEGAEAPGDRSPRPTGEEPDPADDARRVIKGGSWYDGLPATRCASRVGTAPGNRYGGVGFRLVRSG